MIRWVNKLIFILVLVTSLFGQGWNTWQAWNDWLGNRLGPNLVSNGDFHDYTFDYSSIGEPDPFYESDFSADEDGWGAYGSTVAGNVDGVSDGTTSYDDVLKFYADNTTGVHSIVKSNILEMNQYMRITGKIYIPSSNTNLKQVEISNGYMSTDGGIIVSTTGSWVDFECEIKAGDAGRHKLRMYGKDASGNYSWTGAGSSTDDIFYVKDVKVQRVGMLAHWVFDDYFHTQEGTGKTVLQDLTGNGYDLTASGGFDYTHQLTGDDPNYKNGNALQFDGVNDYFYRPVADATAFNPGTGDFSIAGWAYTDNTTGTKIIISKDNAYKIWLNDATLIASFYNGTAWMDLNIGTVTAKTYFFFAATYNRNGNLTGYLNTSSTTLDISAYYSVSLNPTSDLEIGKLGTDYFAGYIPEPAYFNRALSATEVEALSKKPRHWTWNESGILDRSGWSPVLSGGAELTQDVTGLDANRSYKERIQKNGVTTSTTVTGVTSKTYTLTDGTYGYVKLQRK